jgi:ferrochelatase
MEVKTAVVLLNLGGPQSLNQVQKFLFSLFYDKTIINLPNPLRWIIAKIISITRTKKAKDIYSLLGGRSPIVEETNKQAEELQKELEKISSNLKVFVCMRHSEPNIDRLDKNIRLYKPDQIVAIPLYPQFSYTTTHSAVEQIKERFIDIKTKFIGCFYSHPDFIDAQVDLINEALSQVDLNQTILLFSAHGLPISIIKAGDPYQSQIEKTVEMIINKLPKVDYKITYQSRVGPVKWLEPNTEHEILHACNNNKQIVIVPISFVSEHSETLVELDIEYAEIAKKNNTKYVRVPTVRANKKFISCLRSIIETSIQTEKVVTSSEEKRLCDPKFKYCICK